LLLAGCAHSQPSGYGVALFGDTPYTDSEVERLDRLIDDLNAEHVEIVVHLGDIGSARNACNDEWLDARKAQLARIRHPLVVVPGDNEWTDCKDPQARLAAWRERFCGAPFAVETQPGEYCEHRRWQAGGLLFVTLNVPGTSNNRRDPEERARRMKAVLAWLDESARIAERGKLTLLLLMQADPFVTVPEDGFAELRERLKALGQRMPEKVVLAHGDTHIYRDDEPWPGVHRIEVWGSPFVSYVVGDAQRGVLRFDVPTMR
jgi:hypothetical protein